jgi:hypothetical protein
MEHVQYSGGIMSSEIKKIVQDLNILFASLEEQLELMQEQVKDLITDIDKIVRPE